MARDIRKDMDDYLPRYYADSAAVTNLLDREYAEVQSLNDAITDVLNQFFIDSATWGLANWERLCGITVDETKPTAQRRSLIKSKMRGIGTVTAALIQNVTESYDGGDVTVTEDNAAYTVTITFVSTRGVPSNLPDIQATLRDIIPAHLGISFVFNFLRWDELDSYAVSWDELDADAMTWDQFEVWKPSGEMWLDTTAQPDTYALDDTTTWDDTLDTGGALINYMFGS